MSTCQRSNIQGAREQIVINTSNSHHRSLFPNTCESGGLSAWQIIYLWTNQRSLHAERSLWSQTWATLPFTDWLPSQPGRFDTWIELDWSGQIKIFQQPRFRWNVYDLAWDVQIYITRGRYRYSRMFWYLFLLYVIYNIWLCFMIWGPAASDKIVYSVQASFTRIHIKFGDAEAPIKRSNAGHVAPSQLLVARCRQNRAKCCHEKWRSVSSDTATPKWASNTVWGSSGRGL